MDVSDVDVHLNDLQAGCSLNLFNDVAANGVGHLDDGSAVVHHHGDFNGGLGFAFLNADSARDIGLSVGNDLLLR